MRSEEGKERKIEWELCEGEKDRERDRQRYRERQKQRKSEMKKDYRVRREIISKNELIEILGENIRKRERENNWEWRRFTERETKRERVSKAADCEDMEIRSRGEIITVTSNVNNNIEPQTFTSSKNLMNELENAFIGRQLWKIFTNEGKISQIPTS